MESLLSINKCKGMFSGSREKLKDRNIPKIKPFSRRINDRFGNTKHEKTGEWLQHKGYDLERIKITEKITRTKAASLIQARDSNRRNISYRKSSCELTISRKQEKK